MLKTSNKSSLDKLKEDLGTTSLDKTDPEIEKNWVIEAESRYDAYKRGELEAIDWEDIRGIREVDIL